MDRRTILKSIAAAPLAPIGSHQLLIFLLQAALTYFNVSTFLLQIAYGLEERPKEKEFVALAAIDEDERARQHPEHLTDVGVGRSGQRHALLCRHLDLDDLDGGRIGAASTRVPLPSATSMSLVPLPFFSPETLSLAAFVAASLIFLPMPAMSTTLSLRCAFLSCYEVASIFCFISLRKDPRSLLRFSYFLTLFNSSAERPSSRSETSSTFISS